MHHWIAREENGVYYATLLNQQGWFWDTIRQHPIPFSDQREAQRAVARLNARDAA